MPIVVNVYWLDRLWTPIGGGADVDDHPLEDLNAEDEIEVRRFIREYLAPHFAEYGSDEQFRLKETLRYGLNAFDDRSLEQAFDRCMPPFAAPRNIRWLYEVIWQELFGPEDLHIQDFAQYVVDNDFRRLSLRD
jgi:hypothetical protein